MYRASVEANQQTSAVLKTQEHVPTNGGRHEVPQQSAEPGAGTRSREPREEPPLEPEVTDRAVRNPESQDDGAVDTRGQTQPEVSKKKRSTARSAAIIVGIAAAGAAIGGVTGGGKGAVIGAISGGG